MDVFLVTVVIPFYNEENHLINAVNSVLNQNYKSIEVILVNDGSTDNSEKIATNICKENLQCKLITVKNNGPGNARNIGVENANGKFVTFLDADDTLEKNAVKILTENLIQKKVDISIGMYRMIDSENQYVKKSFWNDENVIDANNAILLVLQNTLIPTVWGKLFKTELAKQCRFPVISWKEDDVFMLQYLNLSSKVSVVNNNIIKINCQNNSLTRQVVSIKMIEDFSYSYQEQLKLIQPNKKLEKALLISYLHTLLTFFLSLKIDWNALKNRKIILNKFETEVNKLHSKSKKHAISFKQRVLFKLLNLTKLIGWKGSFLIMSLFKQKKIKVLRKIKS